MANTKNKRSFLSDNEEIEVMTMEGIVKGEGYNDVSLIDEERAKTALKNMRTQLQIEGDRQKLQTGRSMLAVIALASEKASSPEFWENLQVKNAYDAKCLMEAQKIALQNYENLTRLDSVDEKGTAAFTQVMIRTVDEHGNETKIFTEAGKR